jgi:hypothetical protein
MIIFGVEQYIARAYKAGQGDERAKIVAWLRDGVAMSDFYLNHVEAREIAQYIEAGEHLK